MASTLEATIVEPLILSATETVIDIMVEDSILSATKTVADIMVEA